MVWMPEDAFTRWHREGMLLQKAWPEGSAADRELLLTGTDADCWKRYVEIFDKDDSEEYP
jgi:hypothetical protein